MTDRNVRLLTVLLLVLVFGLFIFLMVYATEVEAQQTPWDQWDAPVCQCVCGTVLTATPTSTPEAGVTPTSTPEPTEQPHCDQGRGNGDDGCSPGNSDNQHGQNDPQGGPRR